MFVKKTFKKTDGKEKTIKFNNFKTSCNCDLDDAMLELNTPKMAYNFCNSSGALKSGYGAKEVSLQKREDFTQFDRLLDYDYYGDIKYLNMWRFDYFSTTYNQYFKKFIFYCDDGGLYWANMYGSDFGIYDVMGLSFTSEPTALHYRQGENDLLIMSSPTDGMVVWNNSNLPRAVPTAPKICSMCLQNSRLFAVVSNDQNKIWYSTNLDPTDWVSVGDDGAGAIEMTDQRGKLNIVLTFLGNVYAFRDYGISKIITHGTELSVSQLYASSSKIYPKTICVCGDRIIFLTDEGVFSFDGNNTDKIYLNISSIWDPFNTSPVACYFDGKYFIACKLDFGDSNNLLDEASAGCVNNAIVALDLATNEYSITRGIDVRNMLPVVDNFLSKVMLCLNGAHSGVIGEITKDGLYFGSPMEKFWQSPVVDVGSGNKVKLIKHLLIKTTTNCQVTINTENKSKTIQVSGKPAIQKINVKLKGRTFSLKITSQVATANISNVEVVVSGV